MPAAQRTDSQTLIHIAETLEKILSVLGLQLVASNSMTDAARMLKRIGLDNQSISEILNTTPATVRTMTTNLSSKR